MMGVLTGGCALSSSVTKSGAIVDRFAAGSGAISEADLAAPVIDLRKPSELIGARDTEPRDFSWYQSMPLDDPDFAHLKRPGVTVEDFVGHYRRLETASAKHVAAALAATRTHGRVSICCKLGRDRTGIVAAGVLLALDVALADVLSFTLEPFIRYSTPSPALLQLLDARGEEWQLFAARNEVAQQAMLQHLQSVSHP